MSAQPNTGPRVPNRPSIRDQLLGACDTSAVSPHGNRQCESILPSGPEVPSAQTSMQGSRNAAISPLMATTASSSPKIGSQKGTPIFTELGDEFIRVPRKLWHLLHRNSCIKFLTAAGMSAEHYVVFVSGDQIAARLCSDDSAVTVSIDDVMEIQKRLEMKCFIELYMIKAALKEKRRAIEHAARRQKIADERIAALENTVAELVSKLKTQGM